MAEARWKKSIRDYESEIIDLEDELARFGEIKELATREEVSLEQVAKLIQHYVILRPAKGAQVWDTDEDGRYFCAARRHRMNSYDVAANKCWYCTNEEAS